MSNCILIEGPFVDIHLAKDIYKRVLLSAELMWTFDIKCLHVLLHLQGPNAIYSTNAISVIILD